MGIMCEKLKKSFASVVIAGLYQWETSRKVCPYPLWRPCAAATEKKAKQHQVEPNTQNRKAMDLV